MTQPPLVQSFIQKLTQALKLAKEGDKSAAHNLYLEAKADWPNVSKLVDPEKPYDALLALMYWATSDTSDSKYNYIESAEETLSELSKG